MNTLYWLTVLGHVNYVAIFASVALLFFFIALTILVVFDEYFDWPENSKIIHEKHGRCCQKDKYKLWQRQQD